MRDDQYFILSGTQAVHEVMTGAYLLKSRDALMLGALQLRVDLEEYKKNTEESLRYLLVETNNMLKLCTLYTDTDKSVLNFKSEIAA